MQLCWNRRSWVSTRLDLWKNCFLYILIWCINSFCFYNSVSWLLFNVFENSLTNIWIILGDVSSGDRRGSRDPGAAEAAFWPHLLHREQHGWETGDGSSSSSSHTSDFRTGWKKAPVMLTRTVTLLWHAGSIQFYGIVQPKMKIHHLLPFRLFQTCLISLFYAKQTEKCLSVDLSMQCKSMGSNIILDPIDFNWKKKNPHECLHESE